MPSRTPLYATTEAALFGAVVPVGSYYALSTVGAAEAAGIDAFGDVLVGAWVLGIIGATVAFGAVRCLSTGSLLPGALSGVAVGFGVFALVVGWGLSSFPLALFAAVAVVAGAWANYERRRQRGVESEPAHGTWRLRFALLAVAPLVGLGLLLLL